jgi:hypothetical protein
MSIKRGFATTLLLVFLLSISVSVVAANTTPSQSDMYFYDTGDVVSGGSAQLLRKDGEVELHINTKDLTPGDAYTLWWVIFNNPSMCSDGVCGLDDVMPITNPFAGVSVLWGDGQVISNEGGIGNFNINLEEGNPPGQVVIGDGLTNVTGAEIHNVLQNHGEASSDPDILYQQLNMLEGGCNPTCVDEQFTIHFP